MKILVRKAKLSDAKGLNESFNLGLSRGVYKYTQSNKAFSPKETKKWVASHDGKLSGLFVACEGKKIVGSATFRAEKDRRSHVIACGWVVNPDYLKRGIGTMLVKALMKETKKLHFKKLQAEIAVPNKASIALAKKFGFKLEGRRIKALKTDEGKYVDMFMFGRLM